MLSQVNDKGKEHPISYCSQTLNVYEQNYTVTKRECLVAIYLYKQFQVYIYRTKLKALQTSPPSDGYTT